jgi:hypothetical protein
MRAQLLIESLFMLAIAMAFVLTVLFVLTGVSRYFYGSGAAMDGLYNASAAIAAERGAS